MAVKVNPWGRKLSHAEKEAVEREALRLYDNYNPHADVKINISKADCLDEARKSLYPHKYK